MRWAQGFERFTSLKTQAERNHMSLLTAIRTHIHSKKKTKKLHTSAQESSQGSNDQKLGSKSNPHGAQAMTLILLGMLIAGVRLRIWWVFGWTKSSSHPNVAIWLTVGRHSTCIFKLIEPIIFPDLDWQMDLITCKGD